MIKFQVLEGCQLHHGHLEAIRNIIIRKLDQKSSFAYWRIDAPWFALTKRPVGVKLGGGKGKIDKYVVPIKADRILLEVGGRVVLEEVEPYLKKIAKLLPVESRVVSRKILKKEKKQKEELEESNLNMFTFKYCAQQNMLGIKQFLSPYDYMWYGKYR